MEPVEASHWERADAALKCSLCPRACCIREGKSGFCRGRVNRGGKLYAESYARVTSVAMDPIEKKPLYHFFPGSRILSIATYGCNLACEFCQNWNISQEVAPTSLLPPEEAVEAAKREKSVGIAYTYNEPLVWFEYVRDTSRLAHEAGLKNVLVTNGYINPEPMRELLPLVDAMNVDLKSMDDGFYEKLCSARLDPVLKTCELVKDSVLLEVTNLIIPGWNDSQDALARLADWIASHLGQDTPVHLSAYSPRHRLKASPTPPDALLRAHGIFSAALHHVYVGNVYAPEHSATRCSACGATVVARAGYSVDASGMTPEGRCKGCGAENHIVVG